MDPICATGLVSLRVGAPPPNDYYSASAVFSPHPSLSAAVSLLMPPNSVQATLRKLWLEVTGFRGVRQLHQVGLHEVVLTAPGESAADDPTPKRRIFVAGPNAKRRKERFSRVFLSLRFSRGISVALWWLFQAPA